MKVKKVYLKPIMTIEDSDAMGGKMLRQEDCKMLFATDVDVYDKDSGKCIAKFRKGLIPGKVQIAAYDSLLKAATPTSNRGYGGGRDEETGRVSQMKILKSGKQSKTSHALNVVESGIAGYFDRSTRFPNCRLTAFNKNHMDQFKKAYPIFKMVDNTYAELMPDEYKLQRAQADATSPEFVITGTSFTTITINRNWQTAVHKDAGDFKGGFGNLVALRKGTFTGGHFVVVRWGCGFDLQNGDVLLVDVHQWHGNTPIVKDDPKAIRLSLVMYYRENMIKCGSMAQELKRVKNRKKGQPLN